MTSHSRNILIEMLDWRGLLIEVRYEPQWLGGDLTAHLQLEVLEPARAAMPVSETGYRSHFLPCGRVEEAGGPAAYAAAWLDHAASDRSWIEFEAASRQLALF